MMTDRRQHLVIAAIALFFHDANAINRLSSAFIGRYPETFEPPQSRSRLY